MAKPIQYCKVKKIFFNLTNKNTKIWRLNNTLLNNQQITEEIRKKTKMHQFSSLQSLSRVRLFATPQIAAQQDSLSITNSWSSPKPMSIEPVMPSNHLILCCPLLLLPLIFPSIRVFSSESALHIRWPKYWSFSCSISPSNE